MTTASYCAESDFDSDDLFGSVSRTTKLGASAREFLDHLRLPTTHPLCTSGDKQVDNGSGAGNYDDDEKSTNELNYILSRIEAGSIFELPSKQINDVNNFNSASFDTNDMDTNLHRNGDDAITHPHINSQSLREFRQHILQQQPASPIIGPISLLELHDHSLPKLLVTATTMSAPTLAMLELWLRFFAVFLCPLCLCYMIQWEMKLAIISTNTNQVNKQLASAEKNSNTNASISTMVIAIYIVGLASSAVLLTDSLYVYEYGRWFGFALFIMSSAMAVRCATTTAALLEGSREVKDDEDNEHKSKGMGSKVRSTITQRKIILFRFAIAILIASTTVVFLRSDDGHAIEAALERFVPRRPTQIPMDNERVPKDPGIDLPTIKEGLYHSSSNSLISSIVSHWPESSRTYNVANGATSYLVNGDQRTGIPFLVNKVEEQEYVRVWAQNKFDGEYLALDIAFPYSNYAKEGLINDDETGNGEKELFVHDHTKPVYLVLHGLNGGSHEEYVKDLVKRRRSEGSTVIVLIARGMMDTKLVGWNAFHGARTGDIDAAARAIRSGLISLADAHNIRPGQRQILAGIGYSMGERLYFVDFFLTPTPCSHLCFPALQRCHHSIQLRCSFW